MRLGTLSTKGVIAEAGPDANANWVAWRVVDCAAGATRFQTAAARTCSDRLQLQRLRTASLGKSTCSRSSDRMCEAALVIIGGALSRLPSRVALGRFWPG